MSAIPTVVEGSTESATVSAIISRRENARQLCHLDREVLSFCSSLVTCHSSLHSASLSNFESRICHHFEGPQWRTELRPPLRRADLRATRSEKQRFTRGQVNGVIARGSAATQRLLCKHVRSGEHHASTFHGNEN